MLAARLAWQVLAKHGDRLEPAAQADWPELYCRRSVRPEPHGRDAGLGGRDRRRAKSWHDASTLFRKEHH